MSVIQNSIAKLCTRTGLSADEAEATMNEIMDGGATQAQIGAYLGALRVRGESVEEITGSARAMRKHSLHVPTHRSPLIDVVGTGGDKSGTFNVSTTAMFVVAGAGGIVAKHGNRAASSQTGSADVLAALGVNVALTPDQAAQCIDQLGVGFMFAVTYHPAMKHAAGARREIGTRTIFNILGPLTNPAGALHQLLGVFDPALTEVMATVLRDLGSKHVLVVNCNGVDELLTTGTNKVTELKNGGMHTYQLDGLDLGLPRASLDALAGGAPDFNASITRTILQGRDIPVREDVVLLNAGAALYAADLASDVREGIVLARESIASGAALAKLDALVEMSQKFAS